MRMHVLVAMLLLAVAAGGRAQALDVWLDSICGPPDSVSRLGPFDCVAAVRARRHTYTSVYMFLVYEGTRVYCQVLTLQAPAGCSIPITSLQWRPPSGQPCRLGYVDSLGTEGPLDSIRVVWDFWVRPGLAGDIGMGIDSVPVPYEPTDTSTVFVPRIGLRCYGALPDSGWATCVFAESASGGRVYQDSGYFRVEADSSASVQLSPVRFRTPGVYQLWTGFWSYRGSLDTHYWYFDVVALPGIGGERSAIVASAATTVVRGVLRVRDNGAAVLTDVSGRPAAVLRRGPNDIRHLSPGVYFVRMADGEGGVATSKVVIAR